MKKRFMLLHTIAPTPLQLAKIRNLLSKDELDLKNIEIDDSFIVSCNMSDGAKLSASLTADGQNFFLVYVNNKAGCNVFSQGLNNGDKTAIESIVKDL